MPKSLTLRLTLAVLLSALVLWLLAAGLSWWQVREEVNEVFDAQQILLAERLASLDLPPPHENQNRPHQQQRPTRKPLQLASHRWRDDDALSFAVFTHNGELLVSSGDSPKRFACETRRAHQRGFHQQTLDDDVWRVFCLPSAGGRHLVAVGQELDYRQELVSEIVWAQLSVWLLGLPLLLGILAVAIRRELRSVRDLSVALQNRSPDEQSALVAQDLPSEIMPLVHNLNHFFTRTHQQILRERSFTSDAAHELRSPLAALRIQTEIAQLAHDDKSTQTKALCQLTTGIDRLHQMLDQLLMLSRLDNLHALEQTAPIDWEAIMGEVVADCFWKADEKNIELVLKVHENPPTPLGQPILLGILVRNVVDNAIRYGKTGTTVWLDLYADRLEISDNGGGVSAEVLAKLGQRFYRAPREQSEQQTGSGLGLSIVKRIAQLHGYSCDIIGVAHGLMVRLTF